MALTEEQLKTELESYLKKLAGVMPIGHYWFGVDPKSKPTGVQIYSGQLLARSAYQKHWEFVSSGHRTVLSESEWQSMVTEQGFCPYYSSGDGSTTYRMPLVKGVHPKFVAALAEAGQYVDAGLPNIKGTLTNDESLDGAGATGVFHRIQTGTTTISGGSANRRLYTDDFDASRSNPIYGNSDTVQPPAITFLLGEYVVGSVATVGEADAESLMEAINAKADADVGGKGVVRTVNGVAADAAGNVNAISSMMPDYSAGVSVTYNQLISGYTAPADGELVITADMQGITINNVSLCGNLDIYSPGDPILQSPNYYPMQKNDVFKCHFEGYTGRLTYAVFFPYKG